MVGVPVRLCFFFYRRQRTHEAIKIIDYILRTEPYGVHVIRGKTKTLKVNL